MSATDDRPTPIRRPVPEAIHADAAVESLGDTSAEVRLLGLIAPLPDSPELRLAMAILEGALREVSRDAVEPGADEVRGKARDWFAATNVR